MTDINLKLKEIRENLALTIDDVSAKTKIRQHIIAALEEGDFTCMPPVYIVSFIKTYAGFLQIPENEIDEAINLIRKAIHYEKPKPSKLIFDDSIESDKHTNAPNNVVISKKNVKTKQLNIISYLIYAALGLAVIVLIYFTFFSGESGKTGQFTNSGKINSPDTTVIHSPDKGLSTFYNSSDSVVLEVIGLDTAWLRITIDGTDSQQLVMVPKLEKKWVAKNYFILSVGNEGAVEFKRNGIVLQPFGNKGSVIRNVKITKDQVISASSPWSIPRDSIPHHYARKKEIKEEPPKLLELSPIKPSFKPFEDKSKPK